MANPKSPLDLLNQEERAELPVGGDFAPSGFIGQWYAQKYYSFMFQDDLQRPEYAELPKYDLRRPRGDWFVQYYRLQAAAQTAIDLCKATTQSGKKAIPQYVWVFMAPRDSIINFANPDNLAKWTDPIIFDVQISRLSPDDYFHKFHMLTLPLTVAAFANALGYGNAGFPVNDLIGQNVVYTDEFQLRMMGDSDHKGSWEQSELWRRRTALWASLEEPNANAYQLLDSGEKFSTTSEKLSNCLRFVTDKWESSMWLRVINIPDPSMKLAKESKTKVGEIVHFDVPAISEYFPSKAEAEKAAAVDIARSKKREEVTPVSNGSQQLPIPKSWLEADAGEAWATKITELKNQYPQLPNTPTLAKLSKSLEVTPEELRAAWLQ